MKVIIEISESRFRPIVMTTLTTVLAMVPLAIGIGTGGDVLRPLGISVAGGLGISTLLTLYIVPICLSFINPKPCESRKVTHEAA